MVMQQVASPETWETLEVFEEPAQAPILGFNEPEPDGGAINLRVNGDPAQGVATTTYATITDLLDRAERYQEWANARYGEDGYPHRKVLYAAAELLRAMAEERM